jgi:hypothetical protein
VDVQITASAAPQSAPSARAIVFTVFRTRFLAACLEVGRRNHDRGGEQHEPDPDAEA